MEKPVIPIFQQKTLILTPNEMVTLSLFVDTYLTQIEKDLTAGVAIKPEEAEAYANLNSVYQKLNTQTVVFGLN